MPKKKQPAKYSHLVTPEKMMKLQNDLPEMMKRKVASVEFRKTSCRRRTATTTSTSITAFTVSSSPTGYHTCRE